MELEDVLQQLAEATDQVATELQGKSVDEVKPAGTSRYVGTNATREAAEVVAAGGSYRRVEPEAKQRLESETKAGGGFGVQVKALAEGTGSAGGVLVAPEVAEGILTALRARSAVYRMGPRTIDVKKLLSVLSMSSGATAFYTAENAAIPVSEQTFAEAALLAPKELTALVPVSNRLLRDADDPNIETIIREDLAEVLALRADLAFLKGTGTGEPRGIVNTPGVTPGPDLGAAGGRADVHAADDDPRQPARAQRSVPEPRLGVPPAAAGQLGGHRGRGGALPDGRRTADVRRDRRRRHAARLQVRHFDAAAGQPDRRRIDRLHDGDLLVRLGRVLDRRGAGVRDRPLGRRELHAGQRDDVGVRVPEKADAVPRLVGARPGPETAAAVRRDHGRPAVTSLHREREEGLLAIGLD